MSRTWWIVLVAAIAIGAAVVIGVLVTQDDDETKTEATSALCGSLKTLDTSVKSLTSLDTSSATKSDYQSAVSAVQDDWDQVKSDAQDVQSASTGDLDSAWDDFSSAVKGVPDDASVSDAVNDVSQSGQGLASAAQSTEQSLSCS